MSNPIIHTAYIGDEKLSITVANARKLIRNSEDFPENNFLEELDITREMSKTDAIVIDEPWWCGEFSESSFEDFQDNVLTKTTGSADILVIWESGDLSGLQVRDGVVTECDVETSLKPC